MEKNFKPVVELISALNALNEGIRSGARFNYRVDKSHMYIMGLTCDLASLYSLLWADCNSYCFKFAHVCGECVLECY